MTAICITSDRDTVAIAADQEWIDGGIRFSRKKLRFLLRGGKVVGAIATAGDCRPGFLLEELVAERVLTVPEESSAMAHLQHALDTFRSEHSMYINDEGCSAACALVVLFGQGYCLGEDGQVFDFDTYAIGSGGEVALGALWAYGESGLSSKDRAFNAVMAACELSARCGEPVDTFSMPRER